MYLIGLYMILGALFAEHDLLIWVMKNGWLIFLGIL